MPSERTMIRRKLLEELQARGVVVTEIFTAYANREFKFPKKTIDATIAGFIRRGVIRKSPKFLIDGKEYTRLTCQN